jgi:hypothetical protein
MPGAAAFEDPWWYNAAMWKRAGVAALLASPLFTFAAPSGFSHEPIWLSSTPVAEGDTVLIHAALTNGGDAPLTGTLVFRDEGKTLGSVPVSLKEDEARVVSVSWAPKAGVHEVAVELTNPSQEAAKRTETLRVVVASKEASRPAEAAAAASLASVGTDTSYTDSTKIQGAILGISSTAGELVGPVLDIVDEWRKDGNAYLTEKSAATKAEVEALNEKKKALAEDTSDGAKKERRSATMWQIGKTLLLYIYQGLTMLISKAGIFYPFAALAFFFFLFKLYQRLRRPSYDY